MGTQNGNENQKIKKKLGNSYLNPATDVICSQLGRVSQVLLQAVLKIDVNLTGGGCTAAGLANTSATPWCRIDFGKEFEFLNDKCKTFLIEFEEGC
jgi:hypothetical protein